MTAVRNRCAKTLKAIESLATLSAECDVEMSIVVVDDGSTDNTAPALREHFPEVIIVSGSGDLYWAGAMRLGYETAVSGLSFDGLLVFNDDIELVPDALRSVVDASYALTLEGQSAHVITGAFLAKSAPVVTYGGFIRLPGWNPLKLRHASPSGALQQVETLNMNFALIRREAINLIGFFPTYFRHNGADLDFGLRLTKAGGTVWLAPRVVGHCDRNSEMGTHVDSEISLRARLRYVFGPKGEPFLQRLKFSYQHGGFWWPLVWISPYVTAIFGRRIM